MLYRKHHGEACYRASLLRGKEIFLALIDLWRSIGTATGRNFTPLLSSGSKLKAAINVPGACGDSLSLELVGEVIFALSKV
jgi:hypothetical protein